MDWKFDSPPTLKRSLDDFCEGGIIQDRRDPQYEVAAAPPTQHQFTTYDHNTSYNAYTMYQVSTSSWMNCYPEAALRFTASAADSWYASQGPQPVPAVRLLHTVGNAIAGGVIAALNLTCLAGFSVLRNGYYCGRSLYRSRRVRQTLSSTGIVAVQAADGVKRRAIEFIQPLTARQERQQIHRASHRVSSNSSERSPRPLARENSPKLVANSSNLSPSPHNITFSTTSWKREDLHDSTGPTSEAQAIVRLDDPRDAYKVRHSEASASATDIHHSSAPVSKLSPPARSHPPPLYNDPMDFLRPHIPENEELDKIARRGRTMELLLKQMREEQEARAQEEEAREAQKQLEAERKIQRQAEAKRDALGQTSESIEPQADTTGNSSENLQEPQNTQLESPILPLPYQQRAALSRALQLSRLGSPQASNGSTSTKSPDLVHEDYSAKTPRRVAWKDCPNTGMPTDNIREYIKGEAMDYIPSSSPFDNSPLAMKQAMDSASSLQDQLAALGATANLREQAHLLTEPITNKHIQPTGDSRSINFADVADEGMDAISESGSVGGRAFSPLTGPITNKHIQPTGDSRSNDFADVADEGMGAVNERGVGGIGAFPTLTEPITDTHIQPPGDSRSIKFADVADEGMDAVDESGSRAGRALLTRKRLGEIQNNSVARGGHRRISPNNAAGLLGRESPIGGGPALALGNTQGAPSTSSRYPRKSRKTAGRALMKTSTPASRNGGASTTTEAESKTEGLENESSKPAHDDRDFDVFDADFGLLTVSKRTRASKELARQKAEAERKEKAEREAREKAEREAAEEARRLAEEEAERKLRFQRIIPTEKVIAPLNAHWEARVAETMALAYGQTELAKMSDGIILGRKDFGTLLPKVGTDRAGGWLNDEIVNGYIQTVVDAGLKKTQSGKEFKTTPKYYAYNTFFYKTLKDRGTQPVLRWSRKAKIGGKAMLDLERLFIPIHESSHWTLLVISPTNRTIEYFDSLNGSPRRFIEHAKIYLKAELGSAYHDEEWQVLDSPSPQQSNGLDCGVFAATTAKMIMMGVDPMAYGPEDIPLQRRRMVAELLNLGFHGDFAL